MFHSFSSNFFLAFTSGCQRSTYKSCLSPTYPVRPGNKLKPSGLGQASLPTETILPAQSDILKGALLMWQLLPWKTLLLLGHLGCDQLCLCVHVTVSACVWAHACVYIHTQIKYKRILSKNLSLDI